jgi:hypothetical protein
VIFKHIKKIWVSLEPETFGPNSTYSTAVCIGITDAEISVIPDQRHLAVELDNVVQLQPLFSLRTQGQIQFRIQGRLHM